jgi:hypothetical protein
MPSGSRDCQRGPQPDRLRAPPGDGGVKRHRQDQLRLRKLGSPWDARRGWPTGKRTALSAVDAGDQLGRLSIVRERRL